MKTKPSISVEEELDKNLLNFSAEMYKYRNIMNPTTKWEDLTAHQRSVVNTYRSEFKALIRSQKLEFIDRVSKEVIGEDYKFERPKESYLPNAYIHLKAKNELRDVQRTQISAIKAEIEDQP